MDTQYNAKTSQAVNLYHSGIFLSNEGCHFVSQTPYDLEGTIVSHIYYGILMPRVKVMLTRTYDKQIQIKYLLKDRW